MPAAGVRTENRTNEEHKTDRSVITTVAGATNSTINYVAYAEGIIEIGLEFGLSEKDILERLQNKLNISLQAAQDYMERFGK